MKQENSRFWNRAKMCSLADLAGRFVLSFFVGVGGNLGNEHDKQHRQA